MKREWIKNTGEVPKQLKESPNRIFEALYIDGIIVSNIKADWWAAHECLWHIRGDVNDIECWRFMDDE